MAQIGGFLDLRSRTALTAREEIAFGEKLDGAFGEKSPSTDKSRLD